jgi:hypothetical protein
MNNLKTYFKNSIKLDDKLISSNYKKESITIVNEEYKSLKSLSSKREFDKYFRKYNISFITKLDIKKRSNCVIINFLRKKLKKKNLKNKKYY